MPITHQPTTRPRPRKSPTSTTTIAELLAGATLESERLSSVTTGWKIAWSAMECARDVWQNFFDANRTALDQIVVSTTDAGLTRISAPAPMDLEQSFFLGSSKSNDSGDVGHFGEGLKAAALCLLRDFGVDMALASGCRAVQIRLGEKLPGSEMRPLAYTFHRLHLSQHFVGTRLLLEKTPTAIAQSLANAHTDFFFVGHPSLGETIVGNPETILIARTKQTPGCIFYRNLKRAELALPLIIAVNKPYAALEKLTSRDRDRTAFGDQILSTLYRVIANSHVVGSASALEAVLSASQKFWVEGHPLLSAILNTYRCSSFNFEHLFADRYFATDSRINRLPYGDDLLRIRDIEAAWEQAGRIRLPGYFRPAGVRSAIDEWEDHQRAARLEAEIKLKQQRRGPTAAERDSIEFLEGALRQLDPAFADVVLRDVEYFIADTTEILGAWQRTRAYRSREIFLAKSLLAGRFQTAFATLLHEASHLFGADNSRGFSDQLTNLLETIVGCPLRLRRISRCWTPYRKAVRAEHAARASVVEPGHPARSTASDIYQILATAPLHVAAAAINRYSMERHTALQRILPHTHLLNDILASRHHNLTQTRSTT